MMFYIGLVAFIIAAIVVTLLLSEVFDFLGTLVGLGGGVSLGYYLFFRDEAPDAVVATIAETDSVSTLTKLQTELSPLMEYFLTDVAMTFIGIVLFGLLVFFAEAERLWSSVILVVLAIVIAQFAAGIAVFSFLFASPILFIAGVLAYLVLGSAFTAFWEWPDYCRKNVSPNALADYLARYKDDGLTEDDYYADPYEFRLHPKNHITRLGHMVVHWPFLLFWTLLCDPLTWLYNFLYDLLGGFFHKIAVTVTKAAVEASKPKNKAKAGTEV